MQKDISKNNLSCRITPSLVTPQGFYAGYSEGHKVAPLYSALKHCGMTNGARGFTLIELLVVVLIIGILAAVALPQYQKAVDKTRYTQAMTLAEKIWQSEQRYKLANGNYTYTFDELDLDMPTPESTSNDGESDNYFYHWGSCWIHTNGYTTCRVKLGSDYAWYFARHTSSARQCWAEPQNGKRANTLCQTLTKSHTGTDNGTSYKTYTFPN